MSKKRANPFTRPLYIRSHPRSRLALNRIMAEAQARRGLYFQGREPTQEAIVNAMWLMVERRGMDWLEENLKPFLEECELFLPEQEPLVPAGDQAGHWSPAVPIGGDEVPDLRAGRHDKAARRDRAPKRRP